MNLKLTLRGAALAIAALMSAMLFVACSSDDEADVVPVEPTATEATTAEATATEETAAAITVSDAWARGTMDVEDPTSAIYATIRNSGEADRVTSVSVPAEIAGKAETHTTETDGDTMKMVHVDGWDLVAGGELILEPGHNHIMLMMISNQLNAGDMFTATLHFEHADEVSFMVEVREMDGSMPDMSGMDD